MRPISSLGTWKFPYKLWPYPECQPPRTFNQLVDLNLEYR